MTSLPGMAVIYPFMKLGWVPWDLGIFVGAQIFPQPRATCSPGLFKFGLEVLWLGLEAHGWEQSPSSSWVPIVEAPGYHRHPASIYL